MINPVFKNHWPSVWPEDEECYDIQLEDGAVIRNVEFWAFGGGFQPATRGKGLGGLTDFPLDTVVSFQKSEGSRNDG